MTSKIQVLSDFSGKILGTAVRKISCDGGEPPPEGCTVVAGENERVDEVELDGDVSQLPSRDLFQQGSMHVQTGIRIDRSTKR